MAEAVTFPGTEMPVIEKYPGSRRLDHPNFGDVYKTTYAVGVITDFQKIQDDPIQVEPMAKVSGEWGESDYIPIFYKPKESYWDDPEGKKATDFDDEKGVHAGSWQSFSATDEVVVMLKEGVPSQSWLMPTECHGSGKILFSSAGRNILGSPEIIGSPCSISWSRR